MDGHMVRKHPLGILLATALAHVVLLGGCVPKVPFSRWEGGDPPDFSARQHCAVSNPKGCEAACSAGDGQACDTIRAAKAIREGEIRESSGDAGTDSG
jgi:hypothetical protein